MTKSISTTLLPWVNGYILCSLVYFWLGTSIYNPFAIALLIGFVLHVFKAKNEAKLVFPVLFICLNGFMFLALFSEFNEFPGLSKDAIILIGVGTLYLGLNILSGIVMIKSTITSTSIQAQT
ncbi:MAG: hypothetical protein P1U56_21630 [Saprospiraceae bacterium]|nr:hypothetical protein [Saprospiraceae bacterium]